MSHPAEPWTFVHFAALGAALARSGQKVVVIDFDVGLRNLDLVMGAERRVVFDLINVVQGAAKLPQALIRDKRVETLFLLPASQVLATSAAPGFHAAVNLPGSDNGSEPSPAISRDGIRYPSWPRR